MDLDFKCPTSSMKIVQIRAQSMQKKREKNSSCLLQHLKNSYETQILVWMKMREDDLEKLVRQSKNNCLLNKPDAPTKRRASKKSSPSSPEIGLISNTQQKEFFFLGGEEGNEKVKTSTHRKSINRMIHSPKNSSLSVLPAEAGLRSSRQGQGIFASTPYPTQMRHQFDVPRKIFREERFLHVQKHPKMRILRTQDLLVKFCGRKYERLDQNLSTLREHPHGFLRRNQHFPLYLNFQQGQKK